LKRSGDSGHPCLSPDFWGNGFSFSLLSVMLDLGFLSG
jgi:RimJ/RimL family protein N-acetyltransferase